ncbi:hypothetical protein C3B54_111619 [Pontimonas salivibrio]|uniref:Secreted protein n=1 Tax=Pontimonas salivibrio TaxID=1159327 RepID=A0A2L2BS93_9MICO|nr:DUF5719 family protein [Pontimonas salivibrio]AVG24554.1 hypothetical protein C3B54_111619 [Pontimonas salivibrio]
MTEPNSTNPDTTNPDTPNQASDAAARQGQHGLTGSRGLGNSQAPSVARIGSAALGLILLAGSLGAVSQNIPQSVVSALPGPATTLQPIAATAEAPNQQVICPGPFLTFVAQETTPRGFSDPELTRLGSQSTEVTLESEDFLQEFAGTDGDLAPAPVFLEQPAEAGFLGAASSARIDSIFAWGLAAQTCQTPVSEGWLVAGSTSTGRQGVISLSNPGSVPATVDLGVYGQSGPVTAPAGRGILLQPGERRVFSLSGLAPAEESPVISMRSAGTPVSVTLHTALIRGLDPDGADLVGLQGAPSTLRVLPGMWLESENALARVSGQDGYSDIGPVLRLLAPEVDAQAVVRVIRPIAGDVVSEVSLEAGRVFDIALDTLGEGHAAVVIESDQPIVAGVKHSSVGDPRTDLAWLPSAPLINGPGSVVVPGGPDATLHVVNNADQPGTLKFARVSEDGEQVLAAGEIDLPAQGLSVRSLGGGGGAYIFESDVEVAIGVVLREDGELANLVATPPPAASPEILVYAR